MAVRVVLGDGQTVSPPPPGPSGASPRPSLHHRGAWEKWRGGDSQDPSDPGGSLPSSLKGSPRNDEDTGEEKGTHLWGLACQYQANTTEVRLSISHARGTLRSAAEFPAASAAGHHFSFARHACHALPDGIPPCAQQCPCLNRAQKVRHSHPSDFSTGCEDARMPAGRLLPPFRLAAV